MIIILAFADIFFSYFPFEVRKMEGINQLLVICSAAMKEFYLLLNYVISDLS